ncbi:sigma-70 family RNA polymerase sigma factor [Microvirga aerilata]|uniref:RNA polymerase sigma factor n=1 Tax=Microvirga aerilata TaxID=670292 RepID=A0A936ZPJ5_9HYPH|nr:sigma-70 family RNA polymerase sigma factor [Microvirga aerilata]MBL0408564.1 sigma-70 family RNA polymerase sigma factor [Microvirga aerilata]
MTIAARRHTPPSSQVKDCNRHARHRLRRLRHIHRIPHTQQLALVEEARVSRRLKHLRNQILAFLPHLRAFALHLTHDAVRSDDLVQTTVLRAWTNLDRFQPDTNLEAWLFTILRNSFHSEYRKRRREVEDPDSAYARRLMVQSEQESRVMLDDVQQALMRLPLEQREAILLIGCQGESYEDAAAICGVAVGTMKSRVNRARTQLVELLQMDDRHDIGLDRLTQAALQQPSGNAS